MKRSGATAAASIERFFRISLLAWLRAALSRPRLRMVDAPRWR